MASYRIVRYKTATSEEKDAFNFMAMHAKLFCDKIAKNGKSGLHIIHSKDISEYLDGPMSYVFIKQRELKKRYIRFFEPYQTLKNDEILLLCTWDPSYKNGMLFAPKYELLSSTKNTIDFIFKKFTRHICSYCEEFFDGEKLKTCSQCYKSKYCSIECQHKHWKKHKQECKKKTHEICKD